jgi:predicted dehydrogenase
VTRVRVVILGAGHLGRFHALRAREVEGLELVGVVEPLPQPRARVAAECGAPGFADIAELTGRFDAAVVATPTRFHHTVALDLLRRGVHLLVEKPLAASPAECHELVDAARAHRALLQVGHVERFNPIWTATLPALREPRYIEASRASGYTFRSTDVSVVHDLMIHDIDLVLSMVRSSLTRVEALGARLFSAHTDIAHARLEFENGCIANLSASRASREPRRAMQVYCERSYAALDFSARTAEVIRPSEALLRRELQLEGLSAGERERLKTTLLDEHLPRELVTAEAADALRAELTDFADSIRQGRPPRVTGEDGRDAVAVAAAIVEAIAAHRWGAAAPAGGRTTPSVVPPPHWGLSPAWSENQRAAG